MQSRWESWGLALPRRQRERLVRSWHSARVVAALAFVVAGAALALLWRWSPGLVVALLAGLSVIDAKVMLHRRVWRNPLRSVLLDTTSIYVCMAVAEVPDSAYGIPYVYMVVASLLLLQARASLISIGYATAWYPILVLIWPGPGVQTAIPMLITIGVVTDLVLAVGLMGLIMVMIRIANREARRRAQWTKMQSAIARASNALLTGSGENPLETSLRVLLDATNATAVFVERNEVYPGKGLCTSLVAEVASTPPDPEDLWARVPWSELSGRVDLEDGRSHVVRFSELEGAEQARYEESDVRSELDIPIFVNGRWWGIVGFASDDEQRVWNAHDETILFTAAEMIGAHIERTAAHEELNKTIEDLDIQVRYQHGLAECATLLQSSTCLSAVQSALDTLRETARVEYVYVEDTDLESTAVLYASGDLPDPEGTARHPREPSNALIRRPGWELRLPVEAHGHRRAALVFADNPDRRPWAAHEVRTLQTAAQMIGTFWERIDATETLNQLVRSKDEFIAAVSHEIRTPLTSVVGLAAELRDRGKEFSTSETAELMSIIAGQSTEVADIVNDLLVAARADINTLAIHPRPIDIVELLEETLMKGPDLDRLAIEGERAQAMADPQRTRQILRNLATNAARYGGRNVRVEVSVLRDMVVMEMADDGPGVDAGQEEAIFEPYYRAHQSPTQPASVGLGLAVARQLARVMGGDLVYRRSGGWTRFVLTLPLAPGASPAARRHAVVKSEPAA